MRQSWTRNNPAIQTYAAEAEYCRAAIEPGASTRQLVAKKPRKGSSVVVKVLDASRDRDNGCQLTDQQGAGEYRQSDNGESCGQVHGERDLLPGTNKLDDKSS